MRIGDVAEDRADIDHARRPGTLKQWKEVARQRHRRDDVGIEDARQEIVAEVGERTGLDDPGIVDQDVERSPLRLDPLDKAFAVQRAGDVALDDEMALARAEQCHRHFERVATPAADRNAHAAARRLDRQGTADS